ncbi:MAG: homocysteine S-methyltransferase family protein [Bacteroidota bacterium]|nr:homocysteine S-methyltransferase family protein [Bacteroidota bacterium]
MTKINLLLDNSPLLFDGAMGTQLQKKGLPAGYPPELWNLEFPEIIKGIHSDYITAGSYIITTNSFGANRKRLEFSGYDSDVFQLNKAAAELAKSAAKDKALVAGDIGPTGLGLESFGELSEKEAAGIFYEQTAGLLAGGVDLILMETMLSSAEAIIAVKAAKEAGAETIGVSFTFEIINNRIFTPFGEALADILLKLEDTGIDFIGSNCGNGFENMKIIAAQLKEKTKLPVIVKPNAGMPILTGNRYIYNETKEMFAGFVKYAKSIGVEFIGGCCGTDFSYIEAAAEALKA